MVNRTFAISAKFFLAQGAAIVFEDQVICAVRRFAPAFGIKLGEESAVSVSTRSSTGTGNDDAGTAKVNPDVMRAVKMIGYAWVVLWFRICLPWLVEVEMASGQLREEVLPVSIVRGVLAGKWVL